MLTAMADAPPPAGILALLRHPYARVVLEAVAVVLVCWLIGRLSEVLTPLLIGLVAAYTLDPVVSWMGRRGVSRPVAVTLVFASGVLAVLALATWAVPKAWHEARVLYAQAVLGDAYIDTNGDGRWEPGEPLTRDLYQDGTYHEAWLRRLDRVMIEKGLIQRTPASPADSSGGAVAPTAGTSAGALTPAVDPYASDLPLEDPVAYLKERMRRFGHALHDGDRRGLDAILHILGRIGYYSSALLLIPVYAYFCSLNLPLVSRTILTHVPVRHRARTLRIFAEINQAVGAFFRGRVLICAILAVVASTGFAIAHVPSWMVLGVLMGCATAIPLASVLCLVPACLLLFVSSAHAWQYWAAAATWLVVQGLEHVLLLIIMGKGVELHPVLIIVSILSFGSLFGAPGVVLAVPLAATLRILAREFLYPALQRLAGLDVPRRDAA